MSTFPVPEFTWSDVVRVCRRVCVLRERGQCEDAERLRAGELMTMLAAVRTPADTDAGITERLNALFATEAERVANAAVLAEMLVPLLSDQLGRMIAPPVTTSAIAPAPTATVTPAKPAKRPVSVADFIDDMLAQERPPPAAAQRRAS